MGGGKELEKRGIFAVPKAPENFLSTFLEVVGKFVNENAINDTVLPTRKHKRTVNVSQSGVDLMGGVTDQKGEGRPKSITGPILALKAPKIL